MFSHAQQAQLRDTEGARVKTYSTCLHSIVPADKMGAKGWLNCSWSPGWKYRSPAAACGFDPVRWQPKPEARK